LASPFRCRLRRVGQVKHLEQHLHAGERAVQFEIQPRDALGRLDGKQKGTEERQEFARRGAQH
jgi:hypothetical protein